MTCECSASSERYKRREMRLMKSKFLDGSWDLIVEKYTQLDFTKTTDRLVALSGLAAAYHLASSDTYISGMWQKSLKESLCWQAFTPGSRLCIAPTWSWASTTSPIRVVGEFSNAYYKIIGTEAMENPQAAVGTLDTKCGLILEGQLLLLQSIKAEDALPSWMRVLPQIIRAENALPSSMRAKITIAGDKRNRWSSEAFNFHWDVEGEYSEVNQSEERYTLLMVTKTPRSPAGLVLRALPSTISDGKGKRESTQSVFPLPRYERVGICWSGQLPEDEQGWSGSEPDDIKEATLDRLKRSAKPQFWTEWRARKFSKQFILV